VTVTRAGLKTRDIPYLWSKPLYSRDRQLYEFQVVGTIKVIHAGQVCDFFFRWFLFIYLFIIYLVFNNGSR
jgi:hypothetical protein